MKKVLMFLKSQWRTVLVVAWMVFVTIKLFDVERAAYCSDSSYEVRQVKSTVDGIKSDMNSIESDVNSIESKVSDIQSTVDDIYRKVRYR